MAFPGVTDKGWESEEMEVGSMTAALRPWVTLRTDGNSQSSKQASLVPVLCWEKSPEFTGAGTASELSHKNQTVSCWTWGTQEIGPVSGPEHSVWVPPRPAAAATEPASEMDSGRPAPGRGDPVSLPFGVLTRGMEQVKGCREAERREVRRELGVASDHGRRLACYCSHQ